MSRRCSAGIGKTTLARALCHDEEIISAFDDGILWVTLGVRSDLVAALGKLCTALTGDRKEFRDLEDACGELASQLEDRTCLVVLDNVWDPDHLRPFLQSGKQCAFLITTRQLDVAAETKLVSVEELTPDQATHLLMARLDSEFEPVEFGAFRELARRLGHWPLLLELAGAALNREVKQLELAGKAVNPQARRGQTVDRALRCLVKKLDRKGVTAFDSRNAEDRRRSVTGTMEVSLGYLSDGDSSRLAELTIFPEGVDIPLTAAGRLWGLGDEDTGDKARTLYDLSLLKLDLQIAKIRLHDVLRTYLAGRLDASEREACHARLVDAWGDPYCLAENAYAWEWIGRHLSPQAGRRSSAGCCSTPNGSRPSCGPPVLTP